MKRALRIFLSFVFPLFSSKRVAFDFLENAERQQNFETFFLPHTQKRYAQEIKTPTSSKFRETFEREKRERERTHTRAATGHFYNNGKKKRKTI